MSTWGADAVTFFERVGLLGHELVQAVFAASVSVTGDVPRLAQTSTDLTMEPPLATLGPDLSPLD